MKRILVLLPLLALCACAKPLEVEEKTRPELGTGAPAVTTPEPTGFSPIRPATIEVAGQGTWICTPAGAGQVSKCERRGENIEMLDQQPEASSAHVQSIMELVKNNTGTENAVN